MKQPADQAERKPMPIHRRGSLLISIQPPQTHGAHDGVLAETGPHTLILKRLDPDDNAVDGQLDDAIRKWIVPALAKRFLDQHQHALDHDLFLTGQPEAARAKRSR